MNNFEKATIEYILEMLPRENCTSSKDFHKAMKVIHEATKEWGGSLSSAAEEPINMIEVNAEAERYCEGWREAWKTMGMTMAQQSECEIAYIRGYRSGAESKSSPASVKESLTVEPITAEEWFDNHFDCYSSEDFNQKVIPCMTKEVFLQFVSLKPTVAKRERGKQQKTTFYFI